MNDTKLFEIMLEITKQSKEFCNYVSGSNQCAYTDRMIETVIEKARKLELEHDRCLNAIKRSRFAKNLRGVAALRNISINDEDIERIFNEEYDENGEDIANWTVDDYVDVIDALINSWN